MTTQLVCLASCMYTLPVALSCQTTVHKAKPKDNTRSGYMRHLVQSPLLPETPDRRFDRPALTNTSDAGVVLASVLDREADEEADAAFAEGVTPGSPFGDMGLGMLGGLAGGVGGMGFGGMMGGPLDRLPLESAVMYLRQMGEMTGLDVPESWAKLAVRHHRQHVRLSRYLCRARFAYSARRRKQASGAS